MKKQSILTMVALVAIFMFASCNKYSAKSSTLKNQNDSLNYALGLANGDGIRSTYLKTDSSDKPIVALMKALDKAYSAPNKNEMYKLGVQIGNSLKMQKAKGLFGDSTLAFKQKLIIQGLVNALNGYDKGMTAKQAQEFIQVAMMKIQQAQMTKQQMSQPQPAQAQPSAPQEAPQPAK